MGYEFFTNSKPKAKVAPFNLVGGSFQCTFCGEWSGEARYYPVQRLLSWDCESCKQACNVEGFSLD